MSQETCTSCGAGREEGDAYCAYCGVPLPVSCPKCGWDGGEDDHPGALFCPKCGRPFADERTLEQLGLKRHDEAEEEEAKETTLRRA